MVLHLRRACRRGLVLLLMFGSSVLGVTPAEDLLPQSTCLFVSFPDMEEFEAKFRLTQLGQLANDPVMKPFADDLASQIRDRFGQTDLQLGLKWEDLAGVYAGEACLARVQPEDKKGEHAIALLIDVTNKQQQVDKVRKTIAKNLKARKAKEKEVKVGNAAVTAYELEKQIGELKPREIFLTVVADQLIVTNHLQLMTDIIQRAERKGEGAPLSSAMIYSHIMSEVAKSSGGRMPHVRWYADPFKYADVVRASRSGRRRRGKDFSQILHDQGFDAIRALGGHVNLATKDHEALHRTLVYAPPVTDQPTKFNAAARLLNFPAGKHLPLPKWVPRDLATFVSFNWNVLNGFEHSISLIDEIVDSPGFVEDVLDSFKNDKTGPMIDIRQALLAHLDDHILMFSDFSLPITTKSERLLFAVRVKDEAKVTAALKQLWEKDPQAESVNIAEHVVWEIVPEDVEPINGIQLPGQVPLGGNGGSDEEIKLPNSAMTVARGPDPDAAAYLLVSTDVNLLKSVLDTKRPLHATLGASADFRIVHKMLERLGAGQDSFLFFSRTDEEYQSAYEMIRQGKMPESESMLGRVLNRLLGPEEEDVLRKPEIDGTKMPDYQIVRRYLGPAGLFVQPRDDGWLVTGIMVSKQKTIDDDAALRADLTAAGANPPDNSARDL